MHVCVCHIFYEFESSSEIKINSTPFFPFTLVMISIYSYISYTYFIVLIIFSTLINNGKPVFELIFVDWRFWIFNFDFHKS